MKASIFADLMVIHLPSTRSCINVDTYSTTMAKALIFSLFYMSVHVCPFIIVVCSRWMGFIYL